MTTIPAPRWLKLSMLPVLAAFAFCLDYELQDRIAKYVLAHMDDFSAYLALFGKLGGPLVAACVIAYPVARFFEKHWIVASVAIALCILQFYGRNFANLDDPATSLVMLMDPFFFAVFVPALAAGAHRAVRGSQLVVVQSSEAALSAKDPVALKLILFPVFIVALFIFHDTWQPFVDAICALPESQSGHRAAFLFGRFAGPALEALALSFPLARIYGRRAVLVGTFVPVLTLAWWIPVYLKDLANPLGIAANAVEIGSLALLVPVAACWASRLFRDTRLMVLRPN